MVDLDGVRDERFAEVAALLSENLDADNQCHTPKGVNRD
ncbi:hypothetical protein STRTUCAR8_09943 [Streptomyces turgidiscabies Car8]|uniref:Uncharacterized protein n=1 Tax=Streptomyces turgidiscabies (strain Car8) TaxID=698760 RepID=L7ERY1_STRT8|nr:hypothetical protein STRTUCAR8_09943 [Streptomyces turgidiscabies Car8]GAQ72714.1 hypothetical protein T45_04469 [Streptomyces turgidiscabies]